MRTIAIGLTLALCACGDGEDAAPTTDAAAVDAGDAGAGGATDAGPALGTCEGIDTDAGHSGDGGYAPECDLSGIWIARQTVENRALSLPQYASTWYFYELTQRDDVLEVTGHFDCGIEVQGTATVQLGPATSAALRQHNSQIGRKGRSTPTGDGQCAVSFERFYSVRGVSEARFAPLPRSRDASIETLQREQPLPPISMADQAEDWDSDGKPGIAWIITGVVNGVRHSAQRDWTRYFTAPGYGVRASQNFTEDLVLRAAFAAEEVVYEPDYLRQLSQPTCGAPHTLTLRFLGRSRDDQRARTLLGADDAATCARLRAALPAPKGLR